MFEEKTGRELLQDRLPTPSSILEQCLLVGLPEYAVLARARQCISEIVEFVSEIQKAGVTERNIDDVSLKFDIMLQNSGMNRYWLAIFRNLHMGIEFCTHVDMLGAALQRHEVDWATELMSWVKALGHKLNCRLVSIRIAMLPSRTWSCREF